MSHENWLPNILEFALSTFRTWNFFIFLAWCFHRCCIKQASSMISYFNQFIFSEKLCMKVFDFCLSWSLASVKSMWFKTFMSETIVLFRRLENQSRILKWKIQSVMEWRCSENINWRSIQIYAFYQYLT